MQFCPVTFLSSSLNWLATVLNILRHLTSRQSAVCNCVEFNGLFIYYVACDCDPTGSESSICEPYGGQCQCKPNVSGRKCDVCSPGAYGFGVQGCQCKLSCYHLLICKMANLHLMLMLNFGVVFSWNWVLSRPVCNCNAQGSRDNLCEVVTGQCLCQSYVDGRACDKCERGMYNFPNCQSCLCNGHAETCEDSTGQCIECQDFTTGHRCDLCIDGNSLSDIPILTIPTTQGYDRAILHWLLFTLTSE